MQDPGYSPAEKNSQALLSTAFRLEIVSSSSLRPITLLLFTETSMKILESAKSLPLTLNCSDPRGRQAALSYSLVKYAGLW